MAKNKEVNIKEILYNYLLNVRFCCKWKECGNKWNVRRCSVCTNHFNQFYRRLK